MENIVKTLSNLVWSDFLIYLCLFSGLYFSIRTGFLQVTYLKHMVKLLFVKSDSDKGISSFQAFALAISGRVGTGNIVGVATAIYMGGPGAIFWMWTIAFLGSASAFVEATLGQLYKQEIDGQYRGGPAYYIEKGLGVKWYAVIFAVITIISAGFLLPGVQSNAIHSTVNNAFSIEIYTIAVLGFELPISWIGIAVIVLLAIIIIGGVKRLGQAAEYIVPFMAGAYILMALIIIAANITEIPQVFSLIFSSAFSTDATFGGVVGMAISWGVKRGIYSNEAGQGTAPHPAAAADVKHPAQQGLVQAFSVYVDTLFVCTATALMILFTGAYNTGGEFDAAGNAVKFIVEYVPGVLPDGFTQAAVSSHFPAIGNQFIAISLFFFAFTTIMAYYYYAETNIAYLFKNGNTKMLIWLLRIGFLIATYFGSVRTAGLAWDLGDIGVGLMAWVNLIAILLLSKPAMKVWKDYKTKRKAGDENPDFDPKALGIKHADFWEKN